MKKRLEYARLRFRIRADACIPHGNPATDHYAASCTCSAPDDVFGLKECSSPDESSRLKLQNDLSQLHYLQVHTCRVVALPRAVDV